MRIYYSGSIAYFLEIFLEYSTRVVLSHVRIKIVIPVYVKSIIFAGLVRFAGVFFFKTISQKWTPNFVFFFYLPNNGIFFNETFSRDYRRENRKKQVGEGEGEGGGWVIMFW